MSLRYIFKRHRHGLTELRRDAATEVVRLQEKVTKLTLALEFEKSMRCDAVAYAESVKNHTRRRSNPGENDEYVEEVATAGEEWEKKMKKSRRAAAFVEDAHGTEETAEELERLISEKYETEERLRNELKEKDALIAQLRRTVEEQKDKITELSGDLDAVNAAPVSHCGQDAIKQIR